MVKEPKNANTRNHSASTNADLESDTRDAALPAHGIAPFTSRVRISFYHTRKRLADIDGLSGKAVLDGLVEAGILANDSAKQVAEVRHFQSKGEPETTRIVIEEIGED